MLDHLSAGTFYAWMCFAWILLFLFSVVVLCLCFRERRWGGSATALVLLAINYICVQTLDASIPGRNIYPRILERFARLPRAQILLVFALAMAAELLLYAGIRRYERTHISANSIKEAADSLPVGLCMYLPSGKLLMVNRTMEELCHAATGGVLFNGVSFSTQLYTGELKAPCRRTEVGGMPLILLPDDTAWSIEQEELPFDGTRLHMLYAFDITETYRKTLSLQKLQKEVAALNERLANYNQEIVALTTQREILHAKVRIHEELGGILLAMKKLITEGGSPEEFSDLHGRLSRNLFFIRTESPRRELRDEYELIMETAETLGVHIHLEGKLPEQQTRKHIFATAIHECITNTLRHAHGDALFITCTELASPQGACIRAVFTNNGVQPTEEIKEKGGLLSLRKLLEAAGGTMTVRSVPAFSLTVELPKEDDHAKEDPDRG